MLNFVARIVARKISTFRTALKYRVNLKLAHDIDVWHNTKWYWTDLEMKLKDPRRFFNWVFGPAMFGPTGGSSGGYHVDEKDQRKFEASFYEATKEMMANHKPLPPRDGAIILYRKHPVVYDPHPHVGDLELNSDNILKLAQEGETMQKTSRPCYLRLLAWL
jgi:hypothetical protein